MIFYTTEQVYTINSEYKEVRQQLHNLIIKRKTSDAQSKTPASAVLIAGGSGSGKSFYVNELFLSSTEDNYVVIDSDNIKEELPEYVEERAKGNLDAADIVHNESGHIASSLLEYCLSNQYSFIYDGTMSNLNKYELLISNIRNHNYTISSLYVDIDIDIALKRVLNRTFETGRAVSEQIVRDTNINSAKTFFKLFPKFDEALLFNNSSEMKDNIVIKPFALKELGKMVKINFEHYKIFEEKVNT